MIAIMSALGGVFGGDWRVGVLFYMDRAGLSLHLSRTRSLPTIPLLSMRLNMHWRCAHSTFMTLGERAGDLILSLVAPAVIALAFKVLPPPLGHRPQHPKVPILNLNPEP